VSRRWGGDIGDDASATRRRIVDMVSTDKVLVAGLHMPFPSLGFVERTGTS